MIGGRGYECKSMYVYIYILGKRTRVKRKEGKFNLLERDFLFQFLNLKFKLTEGNVFVVEERGSSCGKMNCCG